MYVGKKIKQLRNELELTQEEFAAQLEISQAYYSDIERGKKKLSKKLLDRISAKWRVPEGYFNSKNQTDGLGKYSKNIGGKNVGVNVGVSSPNKQYNKSLRLIALMTGNEKFYVTNTTENTIKTDITLNKFFGVSMAADHIIEKYLNPLLEISETENIDYKEFIKKYFEKLNSYKPYSQSLIDFIAAFDKFCKEMYDLGDTYFEIFDKEFIKNELEKGEN